jgi:hypothetical protein
VKTHDAARHPGISMHRINVGAGTAGVLVTIGIVWACLVGLPHARWFLLISIVFGALAAAGFRYWYAHKPPEVKRLSIK